ncbi:LysR family transcriptional regulator [Pseudomonas gingeri]|uniref:LysR family transcriptional regulator n=1 Tax=Pseudomonas gingeri TaxID=117681 RepID=UPI0015A2BA6A|nr:LysR substrate-binding domain-containing protein [Pseudomonas gingeri]NWA02540.1 LysR family transcriptional regulator [Pseudomonas gingeri]NWA12287.1 LysR family transcriptional regulator [Pseudomonas gingeri]NWA57307.1 LysR family transcriptional regulator [Pseudomonas gingeri]NWA93650.1 LysR family transcriptional regulator [Pseudomonas gingeri]NWB03122.1 LysR family transcriptional regulator [Pseudomonas gingeri]
MELKHLRAFVVLAEELHFSRAAQRLSIVQPALSMQIKLLEEELGVRLLDRNRHSVALTEVGRIFLPEARATLHQSAHAIDMARASGRGEIGRVRLAFVSSVLPEILPTLVRTLHQRFPRIELELKDLPGPDQAQALQNGQLDFGLMRLPVAYSGVQTREVLRESFMLALPADHPLAQHQRLQAKDLERVPVFVLARRYAPGFHDGLMQALANLDVQLQIASELGEFTTMLALVSAGLGVGLLPSHAGRALPVNVVSRPLDLGGYRATTGLAWIELDTAIKCTVFNLMDELFF